MEEIFVPASGMAMEDVLFTEWVKQPGEDVAPGEVVALVETDKSVVELSGTVGGKLSHHLVEAGDRVPGGTTVAYLLQEGESEPSSPASAGAPTGPPATMTSAPAAGLSEANEKDEGRHRLSPRQRREMARSGVPTSAGVPTAVDVPTPVDTDAGPTSSDVAPPGPAASASPTDQVEVTGRAGAAGALPNNRQASAALLSQSWREVPHFSVGRDLRADGLLDAVARAKASGLAATVTDYLVLALSKGLQSVGQAADIGLAVATEQGVLVPVLTPLEGRGLADVVGLRQAAVARARSRRLSSADSGYAFATLSNLGTSGVTWFTGIVPVNQVALLTIGEITLRPVVQDNRVIVAPILTAIVTADHRHYDGVESAKLLNSFAQELAVVAKEPGL